MGRLTPAQKSSIHSSNKSPAACAQVIKDSEEMSQRSVVSVGGDGRSVLSHISFAALNTPSEFSGRAKNISKQISRQKMGGICHSVFNNLTEDSASSVAQVDQANVLLSPNSSTEESTHTSSTVSQSDSSCKSNSSKFAAANLGSGSSKKVVLCEEKKKQEGDICIMKDDSEKEIESVLIGHGKVTSDTSGVSWGSPASGVSYGSQGSQWFTPMNTRRELGPCQSESRNFTLNDNQMVEILSTKKILFDLHKRFEEYEQMASVADKRSEPNETTILLSNSENCAVLDSPKPETPRNLLVSEVEAQPENDTVHGPEEGLSKEFLQSIKKLDELHTLRKSDFSNQNHCVEISELLPIQDGNVPNEITLKAAIKSSPTMDMRRKGRVVSAKFLDCKSKSPAGLGTKSIGTKAKPVVAEKIISGENLNLECSEWKLTKKHLAESKKVAKTATVKSTGQQETSKLNLGAHARISEKKPVRQDLLNSGKDQNSSPSPWNGKRFNWIRTLRSDKAGAHGSALKGKKGNFSRSASLKCSKHFTMQIAQTKCSHVADTSLHLESRALKSSKKPSVLKDVIKAKAVKCQGSQGKSEFPNMKGASDHQHVHKQKNQTGSSSTTVKQVKSEINIKSLKPTKDLVQQAISTSSSPYNEEKIRTFSETKLTFSEAQSIEQEVAEMNLEMNNALQNQTKDKQEHDMQQTGGESFFISGSIEEIQERPDAYVCLDAPCNPDNLIAERKFLPKINTARDVPCSPRDSGSVKRISDRPHPPCFDPENF